MGVEIGVNPNNTKERYMQSKMLRLPSITPSIDASLLRQASESAVRISRLRQNNEGELRYYLKVGEAHDMLRSLTSSNRVFGQLVRREAPDLLRLPSPLRSDCGWLYRAVTGKRNGDILSVLGVNCLSELNGTNPSYIRRLYRRRKASS
jgi:hypothetical protein